MRSIRARLNTVVVVALMVAWSPLGQSARAHETLTFNYVAATGVYTNLDREVAGERSAAHEAALGFFWIHTQHRSFTLYVDDVGVVGDQTVTVHVASAKTWTASCIRARETVHYSGFSPGELVYVTIASDAYWLGMPRYDLGCTGHATGGTASVVL